MQIIAAYTYFIKTVFIIPLALPNALTLVRSQFTDEL